MRVKKLERIAAMLTIAILLFWNFAPIIVLAEGKFITPGKAITPGKVYNPGKPMTGGQFIFPGKVYDLGKPVEQGKIGSTSGQPILPKSPYSLGAFIIPNAPLQPPGALYWHLKGLDAGESLAAGVPFDQVNGIKAGQIPSEGKIPNGGQGTGDVKGPTGGNGPGGGNSLNGGQGPGDGKGPTGGNSSGDGKGPNGGLGSENGNDPTSGNGSGGNHSEGGNSSTGEKLVSGKGLSDGTGSDSGKSGEDGNPISKETYGEESKWSLNTIFLQHQDTSRGLYGNIVGGIVDSKNFLLSFLNKDVAGPVLAAMGGFNVEPILGKNGYKVTPGKGKYNNKLLNNLYQEYKIYVDGKVKSLGVQTPRIKEKTFQTFLDSKNLRPKGMNPVKYIAKSTLAAMKDAWSPFTKNIFTKSGWKNGTIFNKTFTSGSNLAKMSGPLNYALSAANSLFDFSSKGKYRDYSYKSTEFAADLSVELAIGVGSTALSSVATSIAMGAVAGSAVPVVGTIIGAAAGLIVGLGVNFLINGTATGIRIKTSVKKAVNKALKGVTKFFKKGKKLFGF